MSKTALTTLTNTLASSLNMGENSGQELIETLKATVFKDQVSDAQLMALMVVANQYGLNPWTKEIYAFPDKQNGIIPVVGVDGWSRIMNNHPQFDGIEFEQTSEYCTCKIYRKDRTRPIVVTEFMDECYREKIKTKSGYEIDTPWQSHPKRMLRHKAQIQCARIAFGFGGIYDQDEAERIIEKDMGSALVVNNATTEEIDMDVIEAEIGDIDDINKLHAYYKKYQAKPEYSGLLDSIASLCAERKGQLLAAQQESEQ